ncbi:MAG TPA: hypothetical protein VG225_12330 [Terracidiphilus sp.]|jgi:hypothetical protein|nr:hypothetical protein [Terracidiphilus sp.]
MFHFLTFSSYKRRQLLGSSAAYGVFERELEAVRRPYSLATVLCGCFVLCAVGLCAAQQDPLTIRVEARQVLVPVFWGGGIECKRSKNKDLFKCSWDGEVNDHVSREAFESGERSMPDDLGFVFPDSLRLFEDGIEQKIETVEKTPVYGAVASDNLGSHFESAIVPRGIWDTSDQAAGFFETSVHLAAAHYFQIAYVPPSSPQGSCHSIRITGPHQSKLVYRSEYCNVVHPVSDMLLGTSEDQKLEEDIAARKRGSVHPSAQANFFYDAPGKARAEVNIEFPYTEVKPKEWHGEMVPFALLIMANRIDGKLIARQSQGYTGNPGYRDKSSYEDPIFEKEEEVRTSVRYDGQMGLPPGEYRLEIAYSHGKDFGIAEVPLTVDDYDGKQFTISSIALCKRVRKAGDKPVAKDFVPLVAGNNEFTPAGDTVFHNGDSLMAYFELYEPTPLQPKQDALHVKYTMRIRNEQTGAVALESVQNADSWIQPGKSTIPVSVELAMSKLNLAPGKYRFEIQAADSAGRGTPLRTAEFWNE